MRIAVNHLTRYRFDEPQDRIVQALRMRPCDTDHQTVIAWRIDVDRDARLKKQEDGFGNEVTMVYVPGPLDSLDLLVTGEVLTDDNADGIVRGAAEPLPPELFLRGSPRTVPGEGIAGFASDFLGKGASIETLHALNCALGERMELRAARPEDRRTAAEAFAAGAASARELANILVAAARSADLPARFVSGYRAQSDEHPRAMLHAWAEIHIAGLGWVGFDPSHGISPDQCYVRVAVGLDDAGTAPFSGSRSGAGDERLEVEILVGAAQN
ncbi:MAG: transglutaminase [Sphingomonas sp.]|nr:transglutaminase [Sphingomonas sp.]